MDKSATHKALFIAKSSLYMHEKPANLTCWQLLSAEGWIQDWNSGLSGGR